MTVLSMANDQGEPVHTALTTTRQPGGWGLATQPKTLAEAMRFCELLSKSNICPRALKGDPMAIMVAIQAGERHGFDVLGSIQNICVINGKPSLYGDGLLAVCRSSPVFESIDEKFTGIMDSKSKSGLAVCTVKRKDDPTPIVRKFSYRDAENANLLNKAGPWKEYPERMMQMRARGFALRDAFPDVLSGLIAAEEAMDYPTIHDVNGQPAMRPEGMVVEASIDETTEAPHNPDTGEIMTLEGVLRSLDEAKSLDEITTIRNNCVATGFFASLSKDDQKKVARARQAKLKELDKARRPQGTEAVLAQRKAVRTPQEQAAEWDGALPPPHEDDVPY